MLIDQNYLKSMPDIAQSQEAPFQSPLDFVGMEDIELPLLTEQGIRVPAKANIFVNMVDANAKGIHMSRLFLTLQNAFNKKAFSYDSLKNALSDSIKSQDNLSSHARIQFSWEQMLERKALLSENFGWKSYPVEVDGISDGKTMTMTLKFSVLYSSTCPCSAALARQLLQQDFEKQFGKDFKALDGKAVKQWLGDHRMATPHSQRSQAEITLHLNGAFDLVQYVDAIENCLKTPVQTAVKREDEQEFARLNGQNLMFVEDALRKMKQTLSGFSEVSDFSVKASHFESLHAHDAVGFISKFGKFSS